MQHHLQQRAGCLRRAIYHLVCFFTHRDCQQFESGTNFSQQDLQCRGDV
jgi:hypothetical protein